MKKKVYLNDLNNEFKCKDYDELYNLIIKKVENNELKPIKNSGINGMKPALPNAYWVYKENSHDYSEIKEEIDYNIHPSLNMEYYKRNPQKYIADRDNIIKLSDYFKNRIHLLEVPETMNERSFEIFGREKYFQKENGLELCKRLGVDKDILNYYDTREPMSYYSKSKKSPQNILIIENKDTFYDMRRILDKSCETNIKILGIEWGTLIYGAGKGIYKSFNDYSEGAEEYFLDSDNRIFYFGDLDYEGIGIYEHFAENGFINGKTKNRLTIELMVEAYIKMINKAKDIGLENLPLTKEKQNSNIGALFINQFTDEYVDVIMRILESGRYIPQEILNEHDW